MKAAAWWTGWRPSSERRKSGLLKARNEEAAEVVTSGSATWATYMGRKRKVKPKCTPDAVDFGCVAARFDVM